MNQKKVFVMMSGGVDSSVAASVLKEQGFDVFGVYMKCWSKEQLLSLGVDESLYACTWEDDLADAQLIAHKLKIPFEIWDFEKDYGQKVIQYMLKEYKAGRTPNPDVMCNSNIKFGIFFEKAVKNQADFVATGHYARTAKVDQKISLLRGLDDQKDQSYFLWDVDYAKIKQSLFPVGEFINKNEVRKYAEQKGLHTSNKKDSQGLCFVGKTPLRELLLQVLGSQKGYILNKNENILGEHSGAFLYTIGQREKLGLAGGPWFVVDIDVNKNTVIVTHQSEIQSLYHKSLFANKPNWMQENISSNFDCQAQVRYRQKPINCTVEILEKNVKVTFKEPVKAVAAGQSVVFYDNDILLGGAIISSTL
jgi:tRNA-specific 2-thiouridylase